MLQEWRKLVEEEIVPEGVFTMGEADYIDAFAKGTYAFSPQQIYDLKVFNDPNKSQVAGQVAPVPVVDQPWGMIDEGIYAVANRNQSEDRTARDYRLAGFFGYRDQIEGGELYVAKRWAIEAALNSGYTAILEDPEVQQGAPNAAVVLEQAQHPYDSFVTPDYNEVTQVIGTEIQRRVGVKTSRDEPLARFTTMRVGGPADLFATVHNLFELRALVRFARARTIPYFVLGRGSDLVISDRGLRGLVIQDRAESSRVDGSTYTAAAGVPMARAATVISRSGIVAPCAITCSVTRPSAAAMPIQSTSTR